MSINFCFKQVLLQLYRSVLNARMKQLHSSGIGSTKKQADPITPRKEAKLWETEKLGGRTATSILNTVFYFNCKLFGLRGFDEHRSDLFYIVLLTFIYI